VLFVYIHVCPCRPTIGEEMIYNDFQIHENADSIIYVRFTEPIKMIMYAIIIKSERIAKKNK